MNERNFFILPFMNMIGTLSHSFSFNFFFIPFLAKTTPPRDTAAILTIGLSEVKITGWFQAEVMIC